MDLRVAGKRGEPFTFVYEDREIVAYPGETIAAALLANGIAQTRLTRVAGAARGVFCGMGVCFDCLVCVDGVANRRACLTQARPGACVRLQRGTQ